MRRASHPALRLVESFPPIQLAWARPLCHLVGRWCAAGGGGVRAAAGNRAHCWKQEPQGARSFTKPTRVIYMVSKGSIHGKVPVDIFRSDAWSSCCTFISKQAGKGVIDAVCSAVLKVRRAHLDRLMVNLPGLELPSVPSRSGTSEATDFSKGHIKPWPLASKSEALKFTPDSEVLCRWYPLGSVSCSTPILCFSENGTHVCVISLRLELKWLRI